MTEEQVHDPATGAEEPEGAAGDVERELAGLLAALDAATRRIPALEPDDRSGPGSVCAATPDRTAAPAAGDSPESQENRSIHHARARLAQGDARALRDELAEVRRRAVAVARRARAIREAGAGRRDGESASGTGDSPRVDALDRSTAALLAATDREELHPERAHERVLAAARATIPGVAGAGLLLPGPDGRPIPGAGDDPVVTELEAAALALDDGPAAAAMRTASHVLVPDVGTDRRWPCLADSAAALGVGSVLWLPLCGPHGQVAAVLTLTAAAPDAFGPSTLEIARLFAAPAALALYAARRAHELHQGLESRDLIGRAKGILIERFGLSADEAFARLVASSQQTNIKLREVAAWLVEETTAGPR